MGMEHLPRSSHIDSDDDDDDNSDSDDGNAEKRMEEYRQYIKKHKVRHMLVESNYYISIQKFILQLLTKSSSVSFGCCYDLDQQCYRKL